MPPHKQPLSLSALSTTSVEQLVITSLLNMEDMTSPSLQEALNKVQEVLVDGVLPAMWDSLYQAVLKHSRTEQNNVHSIFIHENLRKFAPTRPITVDMMCKLKNIMELDVSCVDSEPSPCVLVGQVFPKLQTVKLGEISVPESYIELAACTGLQHVSYTGIRNNIEGCGEFTVTSGYLAAELALELFPRLEHYSFYSMGEVLLHLNTTKPLTLRHVQEENYSIEMMDRIIALCPHLQRLDIDNYFTRTSDDCACALGALATSPLQIRHLDITLTHFDENFRHFIEKKGKHLVKFTLKCPPLPEQAAQIISKYCLNLTHLSVSYWFSTPDRDNTLTFPEGCQSYLTYLEKFSYSSSIPNISDLKLIKIILPRYSKLSVLDMNVLEADINVYLMELMTSVDMNDLEDLKVRVRDSAMFTDKVLREIYTRLPRLQRLLVHCPFEQSVVSCLSEIRRQVRDRNLNWSASVINEG